MGKAFDVRLERLAGQGVGTSVPSEHPQPASEGGPYKGNEQGNGQTFYLETFGCQMNEHDSEKVAGVLLARGYKQVETPEAAKVILYNTCSIREKAAQKVFSRLGELRPAERERFNTEDPEKEHRGHGDASATLNLSPNHRKLVNAGGGKIIGV